MPRGGFVKPLLTIADTGRTVRLPMNLLESLNRVADTRRAMVVVLRREPTVRELAEQTRLPIKKMTLVLRTAARPLSLDAPVGDEAVLGELVPDVRAVSPDAPILAAERVACMQRALAVLSDRQRPMIELRYGIGSGHEHTLAEIGDRLGVTRERVRQIEHKAMTCLRRHHDRIEDGEPAVA